MGEMKCLSVKEFRELGFLQELNRLFLHPRGLALSTLQDMDGNELFAGIWDCREAPEGIAFEAHLLATATATEKRDRVEQEYLRHLECRMAIHGSAIQAIPELPSS